MPNNENTDKSIKKRSGCRRAALVALAIALIPVLAVGAYYLFVVRPYMNWVYAYSTQMMFWQRGVINEAQSEEDGEFEYPPTMLKMWTFVDIYGNGVLEEKTTGIAFDQIQFAGITVRHLYDGDNGKWDDLEVALEHHNPELPFWETFGPIAFLIYDWQGQERTDLPVSVIFPEHDNPLMCIAFEDGNANVFDTEELQSLVIEPLSAHNLPPLPSAFLSRLPR